MGKNKQKKAFRASGAQLFDEYYAVEYGERWGSLRSSLFSSPHFVRFCHEGFSDYFIGKASALVALLFSQSVIKSFILPKAICNKEVVATSCTPLNIADMCSAPGGKALVASSVIEKAFATKIANGATPVTSQKASKSTLDTQTPLSSPVLFTLNDSSSARAFRLKDNIRTSLPPCVSGLCRVTIGDGAKWCLKAGETFDATLLDAPCSSERHVITSDKHLSQWSPARVKSLAIEQFALLNSARLVTKSGGLILYSTCALATKENDGVVARLIDKSPDIKIVYENAQEVLTAVEESFSYCNFFSAEDKNNILRLQIEETAHGFMVLPDANDGSGPMYFSVLQKA